eukprot:CAMPEP_0182914760 /NCGR_PEP_ID=MMETSP0034_2-20130328/38734_1 /TAXON_ID=156128 /ORGANISM="Nephroselmis pyriformis, Strain CCMP717" /LENGTH=451 /DNA_ID=CAMNT_0025051543 /DNA_START=72 /DNA_END=1427 /DNA_ORIENTATION=+
MAPITEHMLRTRAEHNEGMLGSLEEVALHQQEIERIENLGQLARELKIIYMQNNLIGKLENLHRLKQLEYINLAVNNILKIENLQRCESLNKLDLTVNFVDKAGLLSVNSLEVNYNLRELFLSGNPCTDFEGYRKYVVATLPQLKRLDGEVITPSERIVAKQELAEITARLERELEQEGIDVAKAREVEVAPELEGDVPGAYINEEGEVVRPWCPETRIFEHRELAAQRAEADEAKKANHDKLFAEGDSRKPPPRREEFPEVPEGRIFQKNEGKWDYTLFESEDGRNMVLDVAVGKYMDTSLIEADVQPHYVRLLIKGRLLQLELLEEVEPDSSTAQRSTLTGHLVVTMPKVRPGEVRVAQEVSAPGKKEPQKKFQGRARGGGGGGDLKGPGPALELLQGPGGGDWCDLKGPVSIRGMLEEGGEPLMVERKPAPPPEVDDFEDDDDVPPLE